MHFKPLALSLGFLALAACATPSPYEPAESDRGSGYSDERLATNRYRVTFQGNSVTRRQTVDDVFVGAAAVMRPPPRFARRACRRSSRGRASG